MLRDIRAGDEQVLAAAQVIATAAPDVILLTGIDWDHDALALAAFSGLLGDAGHPMPHHFTARPNSGMATGLDLDGDGRRGGAGDAQGFGRFSGQNGMAILSRLPLGPAVDHSDVLWRDLPGNLMPDGTSPEVAAIQRLSSTAHWDVAVQTPDGPLHLLAWAATPPVFDGPEDRNGRRNHDEAAFWLHHLPEAPFVLIGNINLDLVDGEGRPEALHALLDHAADPAPRGAWQPPQDGANAGHRGDPALDTAEFASDGPGNLRVDYILPARTLAVAGSGVLWPAPEDPLAEAVAMASNHRLVWVDLAPGAQMAVRTDD
ncbi:endonuclease/exonuclease/phosphatase family protein [Paracoccus siganidrum]|uniref:Endonuclease/exonuclease/phosphatase family protein n=1 Tax=Paracoccus siganidrum TaxID=1276757 RepID=A0A419A8Z2_9RHOB|nr:endonuclease/exonuclease/phosphatase family protein [Paracoccus siganidrum]RMC33495.1 endonuclease/exonuclease/phosphatase family protein [Paracoccus siganidrum]